MIPENILLHQNEEIRPIQGYEGLYSITSFGRVWSHKRKVRFGRGYRIIGGYFLRFKIDKNNYFRICLRNRDSVVYFSIARLVAQAFIPNPQNLPEVNHKDGNKQNNFAGTRENSYIDGNLERCTQQDNKNHAMINKLYTYKKTSEYCGVYFKFDKRRKKWWVAQIQHDKNKKEIGKYYTEIEAAKAYNNYVIKNNLNRYLNKV